MKSWLIDSSRFIRQTAALALIGAMGFVSILSAEPPQTETVEVAPPTSPRESDTGHITVKDSLRIARDPSTDAEAMLNAIRWEPSEFDVSIRMNGNGRSMVGELNFPSARPNGNEIVDRVHVEWRPALDEQGRLIKAPAIVIVHSMSSLMPVARPLALTMQRNGVHTFLLHLPGFGKRYAPDVRLSQDQFASYCHQAVADARRTRDVVAAMPMVDQTRIGIQGTSLGGFVASGAASVDGAFDSVFLLACGAEVHDMFHKGTAVTPWIRRWLEAGGYRGDKLKKMLDLVEPGHISHRLDPGRTWLFSAKNDQVVPPLNAAALARRARLGREHHIWLEGDHFTFVLELEKMTSIMQRELQRPAGPPPAE